MNSPLSIPLNDGIRFLRKFFHFSSLEKFLQLVLREANTNATLTLIYSMNLKWIWHGWSTSWTRECRALKARVQAGKV